MSLLSNAPALPSLAIVELTEYELIRISGKDAHLYLQGQLTNNLDRLAESPMQWQVHCNAKGFVISAFPFFALPFSSENKNESASAVERSIEQTYAYIQRTAVTATQLNALKKYAIFSDITFTQESPRMFAILGDSAYDLMNDFMKEHKGTTLASGVNYHGSEFSLIHLNRDCLLFILHNDHSGLIAQLHQLLTHMKGVVAPESLWALYHILHGIPTITEPFMEKHLPQAFNLDALMPSILQKGVIWGKRGSHALTIEVEIEESSISL